MSERMAAQFLTTGTFAEVEDTKAYFVLCRPCELSPEHRWDRRQSDLYDVRADAEHAREEHDRIYHGVSQ